MKKNVIQDIVPPESNEEKNPSEKMGIRSITAPKRSPKNQELITTNKDTASKFTEKETELRTQENISGTTFTPISPKEGQGWKKTGSENIPSFEGKNNKHWKTPVITFIVLAVIAVSSFAFYEYIAVKATVKITPKQKELVIKSNYTAKKIPSKGELGYEVMSFTKEVSKTVPATGEKKTETRAGGSIIVYNNYSSASQKLIKNTRFESPNGLIFRIENSITIPGQYKKDGKLYPGSVEVKILADSVGEEYNVGLTDFTIPGFKGDPRYNKFYGRSKTSIVGGFSGTIKTASQSDLDKAKGELDTEIKTVLYDEALKSIPSNYISLNGASKLSVENTSATGSNEIKLKGTLDLMVFDRQKLAKFLAEENIPNFDENPVSSESLSKLSVNFGENPTKIGSDSINFSMIGTTTIFWLFDEKKLITDLLGQPKSNINNLFSSYSVIDRAEIDLVPSWRSKLPTDPNKIQIINTALGDKEAVFYGPKP